MRQAQIESWIQALRTSFGPVRVPIDGEVLQELYNKGDYGRMLYQVQSALHLDMRARLGLVNSGGPDVPAWVVGSVNMPLFGTPAFRSTEVTVYLRKSFVEQARFEEIVLAMAHEMCHVVLNATRHSLRRQEEAVDLTAMLLGFRDFYVTGCRTVTEKKLSRTESLAGWKGYVTSSHGYLTYEEVSHAATYMTYR